MLIDWATFGASLALLALVCLPLSHFQRRLAARCSRSAIGSQPRSVLSTNDVNSLCGLLGMAGVRSPWQLLDWARIARVFDPACSRCRCPLEPAAACGRRIVGRFADADTARHLKE